MTPVQTLDVPERELAELPVADEAPSRPPNVFLRGLRWLWNILAGAFSAYTLSLVVLGWLYRWMRGRALLSLWRRSDRRREETFEEFLAELGPDAPTLRPNWILQERSDRQSLDAPTADGREPGIFRTVGRLVRRVFGSLFHNIGVGIAALFCTWLITGWGSLLMYFGWEFGWLNSFNKGYEQAAIGPSVSIFGIVLFVLAMFYVPLAQVHFAVTGRVRSFFDVRFLWRLQRSRLGLLFLLGIVYLGFGLALEVARVAVLGMPLANLGGKPTYEELSALLKFLQAYYFWCCVGLFLALVITRRLAVSIYCSALVKQLRGGEITKDELPARLARWIDALDLQPVTVTAPTPSRARSVLRFGFRAFLFTAVFLVWLFFVDRKYVGQFLVKPQLGLANFPLIQLPYFNHIPSELADEVKQGKQG